MLALFKTVLLLSLFGFGIIALLLCLKPITAKKISAKWQYCVWIVVLFSMMVPTYKLIPKEKAPKIPFMAQNETVWQEESQEVAEQLEPIIREEHPGVNQQENRAQELQIRRLDGVAYIWFGGMCLFLLVVVSSYIRYIISRRKTAIILTDNAMLDEVKRKLKIKRMIQLKMSPDIQSPMLVGVFRTVIYIPCREMPEETMRMVFLHELTHYKRKDLLIKWVSVFVNAVHWFNPMVYLLRINIGETCEISCDMAVTKVMSDAERKNYMKTILDLME